MDRRSRSRCGTTTRSSGGFDEARGSADCAAAARRLCGRTDLQRCEGCDARVLRPLRPGRRARRRREDDPDLDATRDVQGLDLDRNNLYLLGHSWGGLLAIEYALAHQDHLKALVVSNMMASIPAYNEYARRVLMPSMDQ